MCGIVGGVATQDVIGVLVQGLERLEYRGYDSCGIAYQDHGLARLRTTARVAELKRQAVEGKLEASTGIAHTRWATHGAPVESNAHPHFSYGPHATEGAKGRVAVVHNGIIENHDVLRAELKAKGYVFASQTDTEVIAHLIDSLYEGDLYAALAAAVPRLKGAYAIVAMAGDETHRLAAARSGSPLVLGVSDQGCYLASDALALAGVAGQFLYLEEGDTVDVQLGKYWVFDREGQEVMRILQTVRAHTAAAELGPYRHYMQKEIFEQPKAIADTLEGIDVLGAHLFDGKTAANPAQAPRAQELFDQIDSVLILACGTSYYSGCTAKYWLESIAGIPTQVEVASEYRYRTSVPNPKSLVVVVSQSGETADTLAALQHAKSLGMKHTLAICNVSTSAMVRECAMAFVTRAGVEIGVASTKAFTTQLVALFLLTLSLADAKGRLTERERAAYLKELRHLPAALQSVLALEPQIIAWASDFTSKENALFLGRGMHYPIALEGALKLKEISYIHAEAYPAGELKHGPLALVTQAMPVVTVAPNDALLEKLKSNMEEVRARGGELFVLADGDTHIDSATGIHVIRMPEHYGKLSPLLHVVPLQLLAYHTACARGSDVDKPRNLAKSVTVE